MQLKVPTHKHEFFQNLLFHLKNSYECTLYLVINLNILISTWYIELSTNYSIKLFKEELYNFDFMFFLMLFIYLPGYKRNVSLSHHETSKMFLYYIFNLGGRFPHSLRSIFFVHQKSYIVSKYEIQMATPDIILARET